MTDKPHMNVAIYSRVSTKDRQDATNQSNQMRAWVASEGHALIEDYVDHVSGSGKVKRPAFDRMMAASSEPCQGCAVTHAYVGDHCSSCRGTRKRFDLVLFWSLDRLSREGVLPTLQHLQRLDQTGVAWRSHTEPYLDSCGIFKDAVLGILAVVAKQERLRISERVKAGLEVARSKGRVGGRRRVVPEPAVMQQVQTLRDTGLSLAEVAGRMGWSKSKAHRWLRLAA